MNSYEGLIFLLPSGKRKIGSKFVMEMTVIINSQNHTIVQEARRLEHLEKFDSVLNIYYPTSFISLPWSS